MDNLEGIINAVRRLLSYEYTGQKVEEITLLGLDAAALREHSHNPLKYYGHRHMMDSHKMGPLCAAFNSLRTRVREVEIAAVASFRQGEGFRRREDIVEALNRMSSLFYILMYKYLPQGYQPESAGI